MSLDPRLYVPVIQEDSGPDGKKRVRLLTKREQELLNKQQEEEANKISLGYGASQSKRHPGAE